MNRVCIKCVKIKPVGVFTTASRKAICSECWPKCKPRKYPHYKIDHKLWSQLMKIQKGVCAVCGADKPHQNAQPGDDLHIDHDHVTGAVRGLLCCSCNVNLTRRAKLGVPGYAEYLENPPASRVQFCTVRKNCTPTVQNDAGNGLSERSASL